MAKTRLMTKPEEYEQLGINPDKIELWEDGRRIKNEKGWWEWWYFDSILDDGTRAVVQFFTKSGGTMNFKHAHPKFTMRVTLPDGTERSEEASFKESEATWSYERCGVDYDGNLFDGDYEDYTIRVKPINGTGVDFKLHSLSRPYRPGSSYFELGEPGRYYTWLCAVPKGEVTGTLTVDGQEREVHGFGYHDHQWGNTNFLKEWNSWVWARQSFDDHCMIVFDFVSNEEMGYTRLPITFVEDAEGNLVFENTEGVDCEVLGTYHDDTSGKDYPTGFHYVFSNGGKTAEYTLKEHEIIECNGMNNIGAVARGLSKMAGIDPAYTRYSATGELVLTDGDGARLERSGELIYEFMYPGTDFAAHM